MAADQRALAATANRVIAEVIESLEEIATQQKTCCVISWQVRQ
jgi:hypothetical protein